MRDDQTTAPTDEDLDGAATVRSEPDSSAEPSAVGLPSTLRYRSEAILGVGGMGEVRLCRDAIIGRDVALKQMLPEVRDRGRARSRFTREALVQARLEHPSIVPVYDVGLADPEGPWFTMKRIRGRALESVLERMHDATTGVALSRRRLLTAFVQVCLAVDYAHGRGVIHRDLKPGNVMLGEFGEVHVLDWGLAKVLGESQGDRPLDLSESAEDATLAGSLMGTPGYMSPEQARGEVDEIGPRSDVYALGAILFEILTGERLHRETGTIALLTATMGGVESARFQREDIPPELAEVCARATATRTEDRLASARELADAVERYLDGDRDVQLRARLAAEHVERARQRVGVGSFSEAVRAEALRELGRAVALDPSNAEALDRMTHLLVAPTEELPAEVAPALLAARYAERRGAFAAAARRFLLWCAFIPAMFAMGVIHLPVVLGISVSTIAAALVAWMGSRAEKPRVWHGVLMLAASSLAVALSTGVLGVYVIAPVLAATNTIFFTMHSPRKYRPIVVIAGVLSILVPFALEITALVSPAYSFPADGGLFIAERTTHFPPVLTHVFVLTVNAMVVIVPTMMVVRTREALARAERALQVQAWRLRQMLPGETREVLSVPKVPSPAAPA
jgi:serine/threonine-protein kinase